MTVNETPWLSRLLVIGAILEIPVGLALLACPSALATQLLGEPLAGAGLVVARLAGGGLLGLGLACWLARSTPATGAGRGVAAALLIYNIVASITLFLAPDPARNALSLGAAVIHAILAAGLLVALFRRNHQR